MLSSIAITTTTRCDLKCQHCLRGFPKDRHDFPVELLDKLLTEAMPFGPHHVGLTGGEPHLHPQFVHMVETIVRYGYTWHFTSNGQNTNSYLPLMQQTREQFGHVNLSIDGINAETHDLIRNKKGAFKNVIEAARIYVKEGFRVQANMVLNQKNKDQLQRFISLGEELGLTRVAFAGTIPTKWNQDLLLSESETLGLYQQIVALRDHAEIRVNTASALHTRGGVNFCDMLNLKKLYFNPHGEMIFCCDTDHPDSVIGSLYEHTLKELVEMWLEKSMQLQKQRLVMITQGKMGDWFDTCGFCNQNHAFL
jgi:MoaA/NifB/PqqE/SkfB family radical SAM enzyme